MAVFACSFAGAAEPFGRAGLFVIERRSGQGNSSVRVLTYAPKILPGKGKSLRLYADASVPAAILVAAFDKKSGLLLSEFPPMLTVNEKRFSAVVFPPKSAGLPFDQKRALDLYVIVIQPGNPDLQRLEKMVAAISGAAGNPDASADILNHQSNGLKKMIDGWVRRTSAAEFVVRFPEPATAGLQRGSSILWVERAQKYPITGKAPAVRLFRIGTAQP